MAVAYIGDASVADARSWRQAFEIAAYSCARRGFLERSVRQNVVVAWEETHWQFGAWSPLPTPLSNCIESLLPHGPQPDREAFDVRLTVVPPY